MWSHPQLLLRARGDDRTWRGDRLLAVIVTRFREAYATPGPSFGDVRESVVQAMDTAGRAVLFAGCTVVIALLGMMLLGVDFLYGVAISASIGGGAHLADAAASAAHDRRQARRSTQPSCTPPRRRGHRRGMVRIGCAGANW